MIKVVDVPRFEVLVNGLRKGLNDVNRGRYRLKDLAIVTVLTFTGCRVGELLKLKVSDLDFKSKTVRIFQEKKGGEHPRIVPIPSDLFWSILGRYVRRLPFKDLKLFPITDRQVRNVVYKFSLRYLGRKIRPHAIRHSYATFLLRKTKDLELVRRLLGHSNYSVIKSYLNYTQEDLKSELEEAFTEL